MSEERKRQQEDDGDVALERRIRTKKPRQFKVLLHNDNYTTMEFVVLILMRFFRKNETEATHVMLTVHHRGHGVAGVGRNFFCTDEPHYFCFVSA